MRVQLSPTARVGEGEKERKKENERDRKRKSLFVSQINMRFHILKDLCLQ